MTLSRFLRDFLYIPLGGNRNGRLRRPTATCSSRWCSAGSGTARRGRSCSGARSTALGLVAEHALGGRVRRPAWLRWARHVPPRRVRLDPVPLAEPRTWRAASSRASSCPGRRRCGRSPSCSAIVVVIGLQLLPAEAARAAPGPDRDAPAGRARRRTAPCLVLFVGATVPSQGVAPFIYFRF